MRRRYRDDSWENPAWPGLVDLFAFGMVIMLTLWVGASSLRPNTDELLKRLRHLEQTVDELTAENARLQSILDSSEPSDIDEALRLRRVAETNAIVRDLDAALGQIWTDPSQRRDQSERIVINRFAGRPITFETGQAALSIDDEAKLRSFGAVLDDILARHHASRVVVNGTSDPRPLVRASHPRDNVELSALRAASVSRVLGKASALSTQRLQVAGLGAIGDPAPSGVPPEQIDEYYAKYRTISLEITVDVSAMSGGDTGSPPPRGSAP